ncbi:MAG: glycoside hydrolase family 2 TIM barrel-domain containing protein [Eubacteriales bacterium]|nr:glycoside hydrolase family 2 TIM barrel-domain containing protein [Eubacteriales bacterium]
MPRREILLMDNWKFSLEKSGETAFELIDLPHDWAISAPFCKTMEQGEAQGFRDRWGVGWYLKKVTLDEKKIGYCYYLDFGGIYEDSTVWINGYEAGGRKYGYSPFRLNITNYVKEGTNEILIRVDNTKKPADRWYSGAGIYRTVRWIEVEEKHLEEENIVVRSEISNGQAVITVDSGIEGTVRGYLSEKNTLQKGEPLKAESTNGKLSFWVEKPKLWSAETPNLYQLDLQLMEEERIADRIIMKIGIRDIQMIPNRGMFVNGKKVLLKGVCLHQEAGCAGIAVRPELWRKRLEQLKEMGCNAIRTVHHMFAGEFLDLCDEMGFYVYEECFDKWKGGLYGRYFDTEWQKDVESMVKRDRNRACVFIWGVGNEVENQAQESMLKILKMLKDHVRTMDSRPVTYAMNPHFKRESNVDLSKITDIQKFVDEADDTEIYDREERVKRIKKIAEIVDVISCNYQEQWYEEIHREIPDKLILGTETYQFFQGYPEQMMNFCNRNPQLEPLRKAYVIGGMIWSGFDYLGESMGYPAKGWGGALIRTNGEPRTGYYIMRSYWSEKPMVHFAVMDYSLEDEGVKEHWDMPFYAEHWHFPQFHRAVIPYMIASNCEEVRLFLNGKQFYIERPDSFPNRLITGFLPWQPGTVEAIGYREGNEVCRHTVITPGTAVKLLFERRTIKCKAEKGYEILLTVRAADEEGRPYFRESSRVRFVVEGPARILAVDNGDLMSNESYQEKAIHMYHGKASVLLALTGEPGRITVRAYAEGMRHGEMIVCADPMR